MSGRAPARVGFGFDVHRLVEGRRLVLGGVEVPYPRGLAGHSDADVVLHAVMDALLGAAALGDIGHHFPPGDEQYRDISSIILLQRVVDLLTARQLVAGNIDVVVVAEEPKILPHVRAMRSTIARTLGIAVENVSIKGKTTEGLGYTGRGEGIAAYAVVSLQVVDG
ncbi:MAG: 2-C-methyl-D-erythritol 2,4-cyclodiphosphate synthase [Chloroflexi bacterium]|nr:2-C-methyl-D-erythritol 2,4-cyclodiphosphate synthase [Chloroflexota bacterium]